MYTNALYVFDIKFGSDVVNLMKEFTPHPITNNRNKDAKNLFMRFLSFLFYIV